MTVELKPETEQLVQEELRSGHFQTLDELIIQGVHALREKSRSGQPIDEPRKSPLVGLELNFERRRDYDRPVEL